MAVTYADVQSAETRAERDVVLLAYGGQRVGSALRESEEGSEAFQAALSRWSAIYRAQIKTWRDEQ